MRAIITFHSIDNSGSVLSYPPDRFRLLLEVVTRSGIPVFDLETLLAKENGPGIAITFDDGMRSVFTDGLPVLQEYEMPAHVFLTTDAIENGKRWPENAGEVPGFEMLSWKEAELLSRNGISIDAHTKTHPDMRSLGADRIAEECESADRIIEDRIGRRPAYFAYPFGFHNGKAREYVRTRYRASVTTELRVLSENEDRAALPRLDSYYLQSDWIISNLESALAGMYFRFRHLLRDLRGSQCPASAP